MSRAAYWDNFFQFILLPCNKDLTTCQDHCVLFCVLVSNLLIIQRPVSLSHATIRNYRSNCLVKHLTIFPFD